MQTFLNFAPSARALLGLLALSIVVAAVRIPGSGLFWAQLGLLLAYAAAVLIVAKYEPALWASRLRAIFTVWVVFTCYTTLGLLGVAAMPYLADGFLNRLDNDLFGFDPSLALQPYLTYGRIEFFSFAYGAFIPYINITIALTCLGRPRHELEQFLTGWTFLYAISYLGYIFLPAHGPIVFHNDDYRVALEGGIFYDFVLYGIDASGGLQGTAPSLHVGGSLYLCLFELRVNRLRGLIYLPLVAAITAATLVLRYHYVVDLIAGAALACVCVPWGRRVAERWLANLP